MANEVMTINSDTLTNIANAIRNKDGLSGTMKPNQMATRISNIPTSISNVKIFDIDLPSTIPSGSWTTIATDTTIGQHYQDDSLMLSAFVVNYSFSSETAYFGGIYTNKLIGDKYGVYLRSSAAGSAGAGVLVSLHTASATTANNLCCFHITSNGEIQYFNTSSYPMRARKIRIVVSW